MTAFGPIAAAHDPQRGGMAPHKLRRAQQLMTAELGGRPCLDAIAGACGLSRSYFARAFRASTGWSPYAWLNGQRVARAMALMASSQAPLAEVALECGFADQSHFIKVFVRVARTTPGCWRRENRATG